MLRRGKQYEWYQNGVATQLCKEEPRAVYTHCYGHALNLALSDAIKGLKVTKSCLDTANEITKLIKYSPRREAIFHALKMNCHLVPVVFVFYVRPGGQFVQNH